ncbi:MAG: glycosyltransferase [Chloroflexi bacterium]|nr:glycosyltransferase [Chloroflexota bacterium]
MKALFTTQPGIGHLLPMLAIAQALQQQGHEVRFATARSFGPTVAAYGFAAIAAGLDWLEAHAVRTFPEMEDMTAAEQGDWLLSDIFADVAAHRMIPDLIAICREWRPDVIVRNDFEFASCIVAELLDIPQATISISFFLSASVLEPRIGEQLAYLRSMHGLSPYPALDMLYPYLYLVLAPSTFQPRELPVMHGIRPTPVGADEAVPAWCHQLAAQPTVYASMSSVYRGTNVFPNILAGLRDEPINLILTIGRGQDPAQFGPQPPNVRIEQFIPQAALFPYCDLFITHNPFFTITSALSYGLPLLMIPNGGELWMGAMRSMELGLGRVLRLPGQFAAFNSLVPEVAPHTINSAVRDLLQSPHYRANTQSMRAEIQALPDAMYAVELLCDLAASRSPIRAGVAASA